MKKYRYDKNCFDVIRLFAALQVVYFHFVNHFKIETRNIVLEKIFSGFSGVVILFSISALLITASYEKSKNNIQYIKKRFLRIYPAMWSATLLSLVSILVIYDNKEISGKYLGGVIKWILANISFMQFYTPDCLRNYGVGAPNGSLWTICVELQAYIFILVTYKFIKNINNKIRIILIIICMSISYLGNCCEQYVPGIVYKLFKVSLIPYLYIFILGMTVYFCQEKIIPWLLRHRYIIAVIFFILYLLAHDNKILGYGVYYGVLPGVVLVLLTYCIGFSFSFRLSFDISYGIYLYHMIIANIFIELGKFGVVYAVFSLLITIIISFISYYMIEKPCKNLKMKSY